MFEVIRELWEEANEFWEYDVCDEIIQVDNFLGQKGDSLHLSNTTKKAYTPVGIWFEALRRVAENHLYCTSIENLVTRRHQHIQLCSRHRDTSMLGNVTEEIEYPKRMAFVGIPSVVWLQRSDFIPHILSEAFCNLIESALSIAAPIFANREFGVVERNTIGDVEQGKLPRQIVQRGPKVLEYIGSKDAKSSRNGREIHPRQICSILCQFCFDGWGVGLYENVDFLIQNAKVFSRPRELQPWTIHTHSKDYITTEEIVKKPLL